MIDFPLVARGVTTAPSPNCQKCWRSGVRNDLYIVLMLSVVFIWTATLAYLLRQDKNRQDFIIRKMETGYQDMEKELGYVIFELEELERACNKWAESPTTGMNKR